MDKNSDAEIFKSEVINVFTQTEFDNFSENAISTNHTFLISQLRNLCKSIT